MRCDSCTWTRLKGLLLALRTIVLDFFASELGYLDFPPLCNFSYNAEYVFRFVVPDVQKSRWSTAKIYKPRRVIFSVDIFLDRCFFVFRFSFVNVRNDKTDHLNRNLLHLLNVIKCSLYFGYFIYFFVLRAFCTFFLSLNFPSMHEHPQSSNEAWRNSPNYTVLSWYHWLVQRISSSTYNSKFDKIIRYFVSAFR